MAAGPAGGLAGALAPLLQGLGAVQWLARMSDGVRAAAAAGLTGGDGIEVAVVEPDPDTFRMAYDVVSNTTLWFLHHHLFDLSHRPRFDGRWFEAWAGYHAYNEAFAVGVGDAAAEGAVVLVQDYHLALLPGILARQRPDLRVVHFSHTPFADPGVLRALPTAACRELLAGMAGAAACGFHTARWRDAFLAGCAQNGVDAPRTFVAPLVVSGTPSTLRARLLFVASSARAAPARSNSLVDGRRLAPRVDQTELSQNSPRASGLSTSCCATTRSCAAPVVRGGTGLRAHVRHSTEYSPTANTKAGTSDVERLNETWGTAGWTPVVLDVADDLTGPSLRPLPTTLLAKNLQCAMASTLPAKWRPGRERHRRRAGAVARGRRTAEPLAAWSSICSTSPRPRRSWPRRCRCRRRSEQGA